MLRHGTRAHSECRFDAVGWRVAFALVLTVVARPVGAQEARGNSPLLLELNRLEPQAGACRAYLLIDNGKGESLRSLKVDLFALDAGGVAQRRVAVEIGPVPAHKILIKLFDFAGIECRQVGRVLLNDVIACAAPSGPRDDCLAHIETASKARAVAFVK